MIARSRTFVLLAAAVAAGTLAARHARHPMGRRVPGGILIRDAALDDAISHRLLLGLLLERIAAGVAAVAPNGARVLRPGGRALVWDFRAGRVPMHGHMPDPVEHAHGSPLRVVTATPWRWPWRFRFTQRIELVRADAP